MKYVEAPTEYQGKERSLFLAGGITGCPDWQADLTDLLRDTDLVLLNPRRTNFPIPYQKSAQEQIEWEYCHLIKADAISFWFPKETVCPITLFELGVYLTRDKPIFIGIHPEYARRRDVEIQTSLANPELELVYDLNSLSDQIKRRVKNKK
ncbi:MAG: nucleoside 2-deoxyribosyltransferase domain-containing protein [Nanoarchaeota archaeon]